MAEKGYTILVLSDTFSRTRQWYLSKRGLRVALLGGPLAMLAGAFFVIYSLTIQVDAADHERVRQTVELQRGVATRLDRLEHAITRLRTFDHQIRRLAGVEEAGSNLAMGGGTLGPEPDAQPESEPGSAITLSAIGYKIKGWQKVQVSWNGSMAVNVDIYRNGSKITATANDGSYADHIDKRGKGTYVYQVCVEGTSTCSNEATVTKFN
jgi:hypothetical protein